MPLFNHHSFSKSLSLLFFSLITLSLKAQIVDNGGLKSTVVALQQISKQLPVEKLYVQFDKPYYAVGDTIHFKAYLLNADFLTLSNHSRLLYVEMDDRDNASVKRIMVPIASGLSWGDFVLTDKDFPQGNYTFRAYTNWMRNFGEDYVFRKNFHISPATAQALLVNTAFKLSGNNLQASLKFSNLNKQPLSGQLQLQLMSDKKSLHKAMTAVSADGRADINFNLPEKTDLRHVYIIATEVSTGSSNRSAIIPVSINRPENTDIKFGVEGGALVAGLPAHLAFKALGDDGKGTNVNGTIFNSKQQQVATFKSAHKGVGAFEFTPEAGESYTAKIDNGTKSFSLPAVSATGTVLNINSKSNDSLQIIIRTNQNPTSDNCYLIGEARGVVCYAAPVNLKNGVSNIRAAKTLFPTGVAHFTLLNASHQVLNERMVYVDHNDNLQLNIASSKSTYNTRDSIALSLQALDKDNKAVKGSFSVSVTDNSQVKVDDEGTNLENYLLLTSDLKDEVEDPGYYFSKPTPQTQTALDNLMLVQTPTGYSWKQVFDSKLQQSTFNPEPEFAIQGKVTNFSNKPVPNTEIILLSKKPVLIMDAKTDDKGLFAFKGIMPVDTAVFLLQAKNARGKNGNVVIDVDAFKPPVFTTSPLLQMPWYVNSDTTLLNSALGQIAKQAMDFKSRQLKEVKVFDSRIVKKSQNLNGPGEADQILSENDMDKAGKMNLLQLLQQKIKGFGEATMDANRNPYKVNVRGPKKLRLVYKVNEKEVRFVIDGADLTYFYYPPTGPTSYMDIDYKTYLDGYLQYFTADQIEGIEVMYNTRYSSSYVSKYNIGANQTDPFTAEKYAYIEITTRSGMGPFAKQTPGSYIYKPIPFSLPKPFQGPVYTAKNNTTDGISDLRSTIQWVPNIVTDSIKKTSTSFYSADSPGSYTITVEGIDLNGEPGYQQQKIEIKPK
jgi:hypothetical protein